MFFFQNNKKSCNENAVIIQFAMDKKNVKKKKKLHQKLENDINLFLFTNNNE